MPNEFVSRNGLISLKDSGVSGSLFVSGNISATGNIIAQQLIISSSVSYFTMSFSSGSTKFGDTTTDTHQFTGSIFVTGLTAGSSSTEVLVLNTSTGRIETRTNAASSGTSGTSGANGAPGSSGTSGTSGSSGSSGTSGSNGSSGSSGTSGSNGSSGSSGTSGSSGSSGTSGSSGSSGTSGSSGSSGTSGNSGSSGSSGTSGSSGSSGTSGTSGSSGVGGTSGTSGSPGSSGTSGSSGSSGTSGSSGSSGTSGSNGSSGSSGTSGSSGSSGTSGSAGSSGTSGTGFSTITNSADNRVLTSLGTANTANAEANLTFDGTTLLVTGSLTIAPTAGNVEFNVASAGVKIGNSLADNHTLTGSINMPYTSSGVLIFDDPTSGSVYSNSDNYTQPQIRMKGTDGAIYRTGMSLLKNTEVHLVSLSRGVIGAKTISTIPRVILPSDGYLQWSPAETDTTSPDTTIRRVSAGVLQITSSLIATSFTGSLQGTASYALAAPGGSSTSVTFNRVTASYTFALTDAGKTVEVSGSSNTTYNLTVPAASGTNFADGAFIDVILYGSGSIQFVTASGVTFRSANGWTKLGTRYGAATLINIAGDEWYLIGNLNA